MASQTQQDTYSTPLKLLIHDVLKLKRSAVQPNFYEFNGKDIRAVDIMGVVIESRMVKDDLHLYTVDDGSGVIICIHNTQSSRMAQISAEKKGLLEDILNLSMEDSAVSKVMCEMLMESTGTLSKNCKSLEQGDCAHIQGFVRDFHGSLEIQVFALCKVTNPLDEIDRMFELAAIYSKIYEA